MKSAEEMFQEACSINKDGNNSLKIDELKKILKTHPDFARAHDELGAVYYQLEDYEKTLKHFEEAARLDPENIRFQKNLGDFYYTIGSRSDDALKCYQNVIAMDPDDSEANLVAANLLVSLHRFEEAEQLYQKILYLEPWRFEIQEIIDKLRLRKQDGGSQNADEKYKFVKLLADKGDREGAIKILKHILEDEPGHAMAHNDLGVLSYQIGKVEEAFVYYKEAMSLDPDNITIKKNLAEYYLVAKSEIAMALKLYLEILKEHPYDIETLLIAAKISENFKQFDNAIVFYESVLDIEPWNIEASDKLTQLEQNNNL